MTWVVLIALGLWVWLQQRELSRLQAEIARVRSLIERPAEEQTETVQPLRATALDTSARELAADRLQTIVPLTWPGPSSPTAVEPATAVSDELLQPVAPAEPVQPVRPGLSAADWLSEHGLAWLGGGVLALGGLLLVAYAAAQGLFTPAFRIGAAVLVGLLALGAGEVLRRRPGVTGGAGEAALVAALATAAGATTLYGAAWAAHGLYGFIPSMAAAVLLTAVSFGLLGLSTLHGRALGLLAVAGAYVTPLVSGAGSWSSSGLDSYLLLVLATGVSVGVRQAGDAVVVVSLTGAGLWALARWVGADVFGAAGLAAAAPLLSLWRSPRSATLNAQLTMASLAGAALIATGIGVDVAPHALAASASALTACALAAVVTLRRGGGSLTLAPAAAGLAVIAAGAWLHPLLPDSMLWLVIPFMALVGATLVGTAFASDPRRAATLGTAGAALALTLADVAFHRELGGGRFVAEALAAASLAGGVIWTARRSTAPTSDLALAAWVLAAAEAIGLTLHGVASGGWGAVVYATLGVALAFLALRPAWRGFAEGAAFAALASFAALLGSKVAGAALARPHDALGVAGVCAAAVGLQTASWRTLRRRADLAWAAEAVSTLALLSGLLGGILVLRAAVARGAAPLDPFTEASLRTLLLLAAGLVVSVRPGGSRLSRWRGPALLGAGVLHAVLLQLLLLHPWWGRGGPVLGPPLLDSLLFGLLAPALLLAEAARRAAAAGRPARLLALGALVFWLAWSFSELRRLFHGAVLDEGALGYAESASYALAVLATSLALESPRLRRRVQAAASGAPAAFGWVASGSALLTFGWIASPWWGPLRGELGSPELLVSGYAAGIGATAMLAAWARRRGDGQLGAARRVATVLTAFAVLTLLIRFAFNGGAMRAPLSEESLETWVFSAAWAVSGLGALAFGARRQDGALRWTGLGLLLVTTLKVFLFDLDRLSGVARAASFLALGSVLLVGALAARRLRHGSLQVGSRADNTEVRPYGASADPP